MDEERGLGDNVPHGRPWTIAAAMEPLPPLAPPPARPGAGVAFGVSGAERRGPGPVTAAVTAAALLVIAAVIAVLLLTAGR